MRIVLPGNRPIAGQPTNWLGVVGTATWGPVGIATVMGGNDDCLANFGPIQNRKYDMATAIAVAVQQSSKFFKGVRVTDGTDTAASGVYNSSETYATETVAGTTHVGDVLTLTFTPTTGSAVAVTSTVAAGPPTATQCAAALAAACTANTTLVAAGFAFQAVGPVVNIYCPGGTAPGTGWTSITPSVTGGGATTTLTGATASAATTKLTLTALYTGTLGNTLQAQIGPGAKASTTRVTLARPGMVAEVFDNISGTGNLLWQNVANAINLGDGDLRGPSRLCIATAGVGAGPSPAVTTSYASVTASSTAVTGISSTAGLAVGMSVSGPGVATTIAAIGSSTTLTLSTNATLTNANALLSFYIEMTGGADGAAAVTDATLIGLDVTPRKGMYALRNQGCAVVNLADSSSALYWSVMGAFALSEECVVETSTPLGDTVTNAGTEINTAGVDSYGLRVFFGDWLYWYDQVNGTQRLLAPATFNSGLRASLSPQHSTLNKPIIGIIGSQKTLSGGTWSLAEIQAILQGRLDIITNPVPGGSYWGVRGGRNTSSNLATNGDNYTAMTNFLSTSIAVWGGVIVGQLQTPDQRKEAKASIDDFMTNLWSLGMIGNAQGTVPWQCKIDDTTTTPSLAAQGYEIAAVKVQYLSVIRFFIVNLEGGQTVQISVSQQPPAALT